MQLKEWFHSANGCRSFTTNNIHEKFGKILFGSKFWIATGHTTGHIASLDKDPLQLGWWVSCSLKGQLGKTLTIIFAYHPCSNTAAHIKSVYAQQHRHFKQLHHSTCPCSAFLDDLASFIHSCRDASNAILLFGNMNGDIHHLSLNNLMASIKLHKLILTCFPNLPPPATFLQGSQLGKTPIDGPGLWTM